jgi:Putative lumazine-binding
MKKLFIIGFILTFSTVINAQTAEDSVKMTINHFFEGMKKSDTTLIRTALTEGVIFQTITRKKDGNLMVRTENVNEFLTFIANPQKDVADERITFESIKIDGALASVWTPYKFYSGEKFSHCGANSFQLVKVDGAWKIQYIIDTRRRQGCE